MSISSLLCHSAVKIFVKFGSAKKANFFTLAGLGFSANTVNPGEGLWLPASTARSIRQKVSADKSIYDTDIIPYFNSKQNIYN